MSTRLEEKEKKILRTLERLAHESVKGIPIIVEGRNDVETLRALNIEGKIMEAKAGGKSILTFLSEVEMFGVREFILLLDFDRRGKELTKHLMRQLEQKRIKSNIFFWKRLMSIVGRDVKDVEGLTSYLKTLHRDIRDT